MEDKEDTENNKMVLAKPKASRPSCPKFQSFSALLTSSSSNSICETSVTPIRPKTLRIKPTESLAAGSSQGEASGTAAYSFEPEVKSSVVFKPLAKLVSRTTASQLANLGNSNISNQQRATVQVQAYVQNASRTKHHFQTPVTSDIRPSPPVRINQINDPSLMALRKTRENPKDLMPTISGDRPSYDGYNWRKYGQKQVKGSEYPRSYYKCTHPNCPVKKKVERSFDGKIAEIVYKGEHNHVKPQPPKRHTPDQGLASDGTAQETSGNSLWSNSNQGSENRLDAIGFSYNPFSYTSKAPIPYNSVTTGGAFNSSGLGTPESSYGLSGDCDEASRRINAVDDEPKYKQRKKENHAGIISQEPRVVLQGTTDAEIIGDGFRWRKYGQKVVKGNPFPRSYYRCSSLKCNVRKHVERSLDDPTAFITTYEGKHNHDMPPTRNMNPSASHDLDNSNTPIYKPNQ
ncbi:hypothetical protein MKX01_030004 [Papaver californicum]|nr:hypothetical protein MKX01_030004 [Papaver californicum]